MLPGPVFFWALDWNKPMEVQLDISRCFKVLGMSWLGFLERNLSPTRKNAEKIVSLFFLGEVRNGGVV